jgi:mannose-6-phosphate isomerase-like protein (cupin superfamily)
MEHVNVGARDDEWTVLASTSRSQAAVMTIEPGGKEGGPSNRHEGADQWLYVVAGRGSATVAGKIVRIGPGSLLLVEAGERHEIENDGPEPLKTVNVYAPPEYDRRGDDRGLPGEAGTPPRDILPGGAAR